jgi:hypothetical protein
MKDYFILQSALGAVFASDIGHSDKEAEDLFLHMLDNAEYRRELGEALKGSLANSEFLWLEALSECEVYHAESDGRERVCRKSTLACGISIRISSAPKCFIRGEDERSGLMRWLQRRRCGSFRCADTICPGAL